MPIFLTNVLFVTLFSICYYFEMLWASSIAAIMLSQGQLRPGIHDDVPDARRRRAVSRGPGTVHVSHIYGSEASFQLGTTGEILPFPVPLSPSDVSSKTLLPSRGVLQGTRRKRWKAYFFFVALISTRVFGKARRSQAMRKTSHCLCCTSRIPLSYIPHVTHAFTLFLHPFSFTMRGIVAQSSSAVQICQLHVEERSGGFSLSVSKLWSRKRKRVTKHFFMDEFSQNVIKNASISECADQNFLKKKLALIYALINREKKRGLGIKKISSVSNITFILSVVIN